MEESNYTSKLQKVQVMEEYGAKVVPVSTPEGTIAASISIAVNHVLEDDNNRLSLGCLTAYSALHNTVIGLELKSQLEEAGITPDAVISVVGGGSSFSGLVFPLMESYPDTEFIAIESASVPSFTQGEYRYENPDLVELMPRAKMYTLGNTFVPENLGASGLNYHGKNPLLSLLVHEGYIKARSYTHEEADPQQDAMLQAEGIKPAAESTYAIKGALDKAKELDSQGGGSLVFCLTGNET
jgi:tryptophan synthase beta chain